MIFLHVVVTADVLTRKRERKERKRGQRSVGTGMKGIREERGERSGGRESGGAGAKGRQRGRQVSASSQRRIILLPRSVHHEQCSCKFCPALIPVSMKGPSLIVSCFPVSRRMPPASRSPEKEPHKEPLRLASTTFTHGDRYPPSDCHQLPSPESEGETR